MPLLLLQTCDLFDGTVDKAIPAAYAIELFNNSTVVLNDLVDHSVDENVNLLLIANLKPRPINSYLIIINIWNTILF